MLKLFRLNINTEFIVSRLLLICCICFGACNQTEEQNKRPKKDYIGAISGYNDSIPVALSQQGEVLIAYSDCYSCHKEDKRSVGPAFKDIAKRYPVQRVYIDMLAQRVISGGSGAWGKAVMSPHQKVPLEDAKIMVSYILSLKE